MHEGVSGSTPVVGFVQGGDTVIVRQAATTNYLMIATGDGREGWVLRSRLKLSREGRKRALRMKIGAESDYRQELFRRCLERHEPTGFAEQICNREVAIGMTTEMVHAALGKPDQEYFDAASGLTQLVYIDRSNSILVHIVGGVVKNFTKAKGVF